MQRLPNEGLKLVYGDVTDCSTLRSPVSGQDYVYHLAGCTLALEPQLMYQVHESGTRNLLSVCAEQASKPTVIFVSSLAAAGPSPCGRLRLPEDPAVPVSHYGRSKLAAEKIAEQFAERLPITIVRPAIVFGETDELCLDLFRVPARLRLHLVPGFRSFRISLIHVTDLVELMVLAAERGRRLGADEGAKESSATGGYYFAACPEQPTYGEFGRLVARALDRRVAIMPCPKSLVWLTAAGGHLMGRLRGKPPVLGLDKARETTAGSWACSPQRAIEQLGLSFPVSLLDRLRQTVQWYRDHGWF